MHSDIIDTQKGIAYLAGKKDSYVRIAGNFAKKADGKIDEMRQFFERFCQSRDEEDLKRLITEFHGLKSSSASMGATLLPEFAKELEMAGKEGNTGLIEEKFEEFVEQYKSTCEALAEAIAEL